MYQTEGGCGSAGTVASDPGASRRSGVKRDREESSRVGSGSEGGDREDSKASPGGRVRRPNDVHFLQLACGLRTHALKVREGSHSWIDESRFVTVIERYTGPNV
jgi:hypothetical protein